MSGRTTQAGLSGLVLALATIWLGGCGGEVTADQPSGRLGETAEVEREDASAKGAGESLLDRLFDERTRPLTVPPGTVVELRFTETVSSAASSTGDTFRTTVDDDVTVNGRIAIPAGSVVTGYVTEAHQPRKVGGRARLSLEFAALELPSGASAPVEAVFARRGKSENLEDAAIIAGSTLGGVILGEAIDEGEGGVVGGILGGVGGAIAASKTKAKPVQIPAGTVMTIELVRPVTLDVPT